MDKLFGFVIPERVSKGSFRGLDPKDLALNFQRQQHVKRVAEAVMIGREGRVREGNLAHEVFYPVQIVEVRRIRGRNNYLKFGSYPAASRALSRFRVTDLMGFGFEREYQSIPFSVFEHYESKLQENSRALRAEDWKENVIGAWENRELLATLMDNEWLGLKLLTQIKSSSKITVEDLATGVRVGMSVIMPTLARLVRFGAVDVEDEFFICTNKGADLIRHIEERAEVTLIPR